MKYRDYITQDPGTCGGQPVLAGTRVLLRTVLGYLAHGASSDEIRADFPTLTAEHVRAAIAFAATSAAEDIPPPNPFPFTNGL